MSESEGDTHAINRHYDDGSVNYGLFQVSPKHSLPLCKGDFEVESNSQDVTSSLFCVVLYETIDTDPSEVQRAYLIQIKDTETFSPSITTVPQNTLKKNYYYYCFYIHNSYTTDHYLGRKILLKLFEVVLVCASNK